MVCVVTRYFGGILLGAGGLVRAYTKGAKIAVDAAGKSMKRVWTAVYVPCPYPFYERVKLEAAAFGGILRKTDFGAEVELELLFPEGQVSAFLEKLHRPVQRNREQVHGDRTRNTGPSRCEPRRSRESGDGHKVRRMTMTIRETGWSRRSTSACGLWRPSPNHEQAAPSGMRSPERDVRTCYQRGHATALSIPSPSAA